MRQVLQKGGHKGLGRWAVAAVGAWAIVTAARPATAATLAQWLFDNTNTHTVVNSIAGGDEPLMQQHAVVFTNLHAAGGPFTPTYGTGMMRTPTSGAYDAIDSTSVVNWTTKSQLTLEMWVNPYSDADLNMDALWYRGQLLRLERSGSSYRLQGYIHTGSGYVGSGVGTAVVSTGVWSHIALTYDGTTLRTYVNGALDKSFVSGASLGNGGGDVYISAFSGGGNPFHGLIDEIRVSDLALPAGLGRGAAGELAWGESLLVTPEPSTMLLLLYGAPLIRRWTRTRRAG